MTHQTPDFDTIKTGKFTRKFNIHESEVRLNSKDDRTVDLSFSSEAPYERWFGIEVLDHSPESVRMDWFKGGTAPLLLDHDSRQQIGVIETAAIGSDRVGRATVRFSKSALADSVLCDIRDGIRRNVSVGYRIHKMRMEESADDGESYRVTDWSPLEASIVAVPADQNVGVGRDDKGETFTTQIIRSSAIPASSGKEYQVNIHVNKDEIQRAERDRAASISAIGARHNMGQIAAEHVAKGTPLDQFRGIMLDHIGETKPLEAPIAELGLSPKDQRSYSIIRAVNAVANKDWTGAGFERECSDEIGNKIGKNSRGFFMPTDIRGWDAQRDLTVGTASAGGNLKPTDHLGGSYIESLRNQMVLKGLGARVISGLRGDVAIPAANAATTHYWVGENGAPTEGAPTFRQVTMSPKTVAGYVDMSRLLLQQSDPSVEGLVRQDLIQGAAVAIDAVGINGGGSNEPDGIMQTAGIGSVAMGTNGAAPTWTKSSELELAVSSSNASYGNVGFLTNDATRHKLRTTPKVASTDSVMILEQPDNLMGYRFATTNGVPSDLDKGTSTGVCSAMIFGNFNDLIIGEWGVIDVLVDPYSLSTTGATRITVFQDIDIGVRHAESFAAILDILTT